MKVKLVYFFRGKCLTNMQSEHNFVIRQIGIEVENSLTGL